MPKIAAGVVHFQEKVYPEKKDLFEKLATGQSPEALFITCSDSRVNPNLLTQTEPGELFICRNAGNIVPPHTHHTGAMTASIEYAVGMLNVPHIVVCGHTDCGAMKGALDLDALNDLPHVKEWLDYSRAAVQISREKEKNGDEGSLINTLIYENVLLQLQHLKTHPFVALHLSSGKTTLHGWVYDIKTGDVFAYDEGKQAFLPVAEKYAKEVLDFAKENTASCNH